MNLMGMEAHLFFCLPGFWFDLIRISFILILVGPFGFFLCCSPVVTLQEIFGGRRTQARVRRKCARCSWGGGLWIQQAAAGEATAAALQQASRRQRSLLPEAGTSRELRPARASGQAAHATARGEQLPTPGPSRKGRKQADHSAVGMEDLKAYLLLIFC